MSNTSYGSEDESLMEMGSGSFGCSHYRRRCKIRAPCCDEIFDCRHCHNESKDCMFLGWRHYNSPDGLFSQEWDWYCRIIGFVLPRCGSYGFIWWECSNLLDLCLWGTISPISHQKVCGSSYLTSLDLHGFMWCL